MTYRGSLARVSVSVLIVVLTAMGSFLGALNLIAPPAAAQTCDQAGSAIVGNWNIVTPQVCTGIVYTVDGSITIAAGGSLTLINGGFKFSQDTTHIYSLTVNAGRTFILDNSIITTEPRSLSAYLKLNMDVAGIFTMRNNAIMKFPGTFDATAGSIITIDHSTITGHSSAEVTPWVGAGNADDNDDAPTLTFGSSTVNIFNSRIERLFEDAGAGAPSPRAIITAAGSTVLTAINSYIGVDFNPDMNRLHNEIDASGTSQVNLVGVTVDQIQSDAVTPDTWIPPFVPTAGSTAVFHFYRWLDVFVTDNLGVPASGAGVWSQWGGFTQTANYPDNGGAFCPGATILGYLGKNCANFNVTGPDGHALLPLYTDLIDTSTAPNAASFGNFEETASVAPFTVSLSAAFEPYPILTDASNSKSLTLPIAGLSLPGTIQWTTTMTITGTVVSVASSIEITGTVTITNGGIYLSMQSDACNRAVVKITGAGRLNLINSSVGSNCPMTLYVGNTGRLTATLGSALNLDATGTGVLRSDGSSVVTVTDSIVDSDVRVAGASASFKRDAFMGSSITIATTAKSDVWDANLAPSVDTIQFLTDDANVNTADFDIRNTTFNNILTPQVRFSGRQWAQLTNVTTSPAPGDDFWTGMISGNAKVSRYWWLRVNGVDGTGTILEGANAQITVSRLNPVTLTWANAPVPLADDIYMATPSNWPVSAPKGFIIYRASSEERYVSTSGQWSNSTYRGNASASVGAPPITYYPDADISGLVQGDTTIDLVFSDLTPEMSIGTISVYLEGNVSSSFQPLNRPLNLTAAVLNTGKIAVRNAVVSFFATNVDQNNDGYMDTTKTVYMGSGQWIGDFTVPLLPLGQSRVAYVTWTPSGVAETNLPVSVVVDAPFSNPLDPGTFRELNERNNTNTASITLTVWPDLTVGRADINVLNPIDGNPTTVDVTIRNEGTNDAVSASLVIADDNGFRSAGTLFSLPRGQTTTIHMTWVPQSAGAHTVSAAIYTPIGLPPDRNHDFNWVNNWDSKPVTVATKPDIVLLASDFPGTLNGTRGVSFALPVTVHNNGDTAATLFSISVFLDGDRSQLVGNTDDVNVAGQSFLDTAVSVLVPTAVGLHQLTVFADSRNSDGSLTTGSGSIIEISEANNWANQSVNLQPPTGVITMNPLPERANGYPPGETILVEGYVLESVGGDGIPGIPVLVEFLDESGNPISNATYTSEVDGAWRVGLLIPGNARDGVHTIRATSPAGSSIAGSSQGINIRNPTTFWFAIFLGLPVWLWLIIVIAAVAAIVAVTLYFRVYGLGKMVECGECGSFIPEDSTTCPKCGVEFEKDMAKCSNCQAWIPVDVKQCPECGVEFATGKVEMADYQEKMRMQYDEVVARFRDEAQRVLGRSLTEREFQDWWRKQPTFVTFEDWLREEEEMRKMGSKPCPACGTLNSVTATVCHKCGTYLKEQRGPPSGGAPPSPGPSGEGAGMPSEPVPKKVIRKPVAAPPIVQKKVIKKPLGEQTQEGGGGESDTQNPPDEEF